MSYFQEQLINGLSIGTVYALIAVGFSVVYGVLGILNFAHSEVFMSGSYIGYSTAYCLAAHHFGDSRFILIAALVTGGVGSGIVAIIIERIAYRPLHGSPRITYLLTAIAVSVGLQALATQIFSPHTLSYPVALSQPSSRTVAICVLIASAALTYALLYRTRYGLAVRAIAARREAAELMGINLNRTISLAFGFGGVLAGLAGVVWGIMYGTVSPSMGFYPGVKSFIVAVVGGIGDLRGSIIVGIVLGLLEAFFGAYLPSSASGLADSFVMAMLVALLLWKPSGIFSSRYQERV